MDIKPTYGRYTVYASDYCVLDSDVIAGGGTDETEKIQAILDKAVEWGGVHLIMDGAALVRGIAVHSNTTIECLNGNCGFYLKDNSDNAIIRNYDFSTGKTINENITLKGGTYNHNNLNQAMSFKEDNVYPKEESCASMLVAMKFYGVKNFVMENVAIYNQKRYALLMENWENVVMNNIDIPLPELVPDTNQDGLHFHAPGKNLQIRNCHGRGCDDFIAINTDEGDKVSSISGVLIDGVYLDNAYQGVRLLCAGKGVLEDVVVRNVFGTFRSYGFYVNPWAVEKPATSEFDGTGGYFKNILIENISLRQADSPYDYNSPLLFCLGGKIENIAFRNISIESAAPDFKVFTIREGHSLLSHVRGYGDTPSHIKDMFVDGLYVTDGDSAAPDKEWIEIEGDTEVENITIKNAVLKSTGASEAVIHIADNAKVGDIVISGMRAEGFAMEVKGTYKSLKITE